MGFSSFVGNSRIAGRLLAKLREGRFPHSLIFAGPQGVGKHTLARMIAKALNCTVLGPADFCDECAQCRKISSGTHPDVIGLSVEDEATQIKIAQVRKVLATLRMQPLEGANKVFIIDPANLMNPEASNALLKGLEEPPDNSFFILIAVNVHELLLTIRSRSQIYNFVPLTISELKAQDAGDEFTLRWSQGSIGRARNLDVAAIKQQRAAVLDFLESAVRADDETLRELLAASGDLARAKHDFPEYLSMMAVLLGDVIYLSEGLPDRVVNIDIRSRLEILVSAAPVDRWIRIAEFLWQIESSIKGNVNRQMLTDTMSIIAAGFAE